MDCVACGSAAVTERPEHTARGYRRFRCRDCGKQYNERSGGLLNHTHYPSDVIALVVLWRHRQVVGFWARRGRCWHGVQAAAATPLTSAHTSNARALAARYSLAGTWSRRRWKSNCVIRCGFVVCFDEGAAVLGPVNDAAPPSAVAVSHH